MGSAINACDVTETSHKTSQDPWSNDIGKNLGWNRRGKGRMRTFATSVIHCPGIGISIPGALTQSISSPSKMGYDGRGQGGVCFVLVNDPRFYRT